jgi:spore germination cell wall hydrolase CwlJ-like protein
MLKKTFMVVAHTTNIAAFCIMIALGASYINNATAAAQEVLPEASEYPRPVPRPDVVLPEASEYPRPVPRPYVVLPEISDEELHCLQQNIFFEARNQSLIGQASVAWVTLNRVDAVRWPDAICEVVWQHRQFSWTHDGKRDVPDSNVIAQRAWDDAGIIAEIVVIDWQRAAVHHSPIDDAVMYHADYVEPYWAASYDRIATVDNHIFYR